MDLFGKTLVLVNFGLSLMMAAVGGVVLYYHTDWTDNPAPADGSAPPGLLLEKIQKLNDLRGPMDAGGRRQAGVIDSVDAAWRDARSSLLAQEDRRKKDEVWYAEELEQLRTNPKNQPILALDYKNGRTTPDPRNGGLPAMAAAADRYGQPLKPLVAYNAELGTVNVAIQSKLEDLGKLVKEDTELTAKLVGGKDMAGKDVRGLIQRLKDEQDKAENIGKETDLVLLSEGQVRADSQLLLLRKKALEARIKELQKPAVAGRNEEPRPSEPRP